MEPSAIVDLVDEAGKILHHVGEALIGHRVDGFDLQGLHEALRLGVVVGIAAPAHRADQATGLQDLAIGLRSEEHTSELQSLMRISYAVFCLKKKKTQ